MPQMSVHLTLSPNLHPRPCGQLFRIVTRLSAGIGIINAAHTVKFTSHFELTSAEVDMLVAALDRVCTSYKVQHS